MSSISTIGASELASRLADGTVDQFWNALTDAYFTGEMIPGSRRVPVDQVAREVLKTGLAKDTSIVVYCSGPACPNSRVAAEKLSTLGYTNVVLFEGGLEEWKAEGRATDRIEAHCVVA